MRNTRPMDIPYGCPYLSMHNNLFGIHEELAKYVVQEDDWEEPEEGDNSPRARAYNAIFPTSPLNPPKGQFYEFDLSDPVELREGPYDTHPWFTCSWWVLIEHPEYGLFVTDQGAGQGYSWWNIIWMEMPWDEFVRLCLEDVRFNYCYYDHGTWLASDSPFPYLHGSRTRIVPLQECTVRIEGWQRVGVTLYEAPGEGGGFFALSSDD